MKKQSSLHNFLETTSIKPHRKVTLTDLFSGQISTKNFTSQKITSGRPQTMHLPRSKLSSHHQSSQRNAATQHRNRNQKRQNQTQLRYSASELKLKDSEKYKVKKIYGKINLLADGGVTDQQNELLSIFEFLQALSKTNNYHQKSFAYLTKKLKEGIYADFNLPGLRQTIIKTRNAQLAKQLNYDLVRIQNKNSNLTYKEVVSEFIRQIQRCLQVKQSDQKTHLQIVEDLEQKLQQKEEIIDNIKRQLLYYIKHPSQDLYPYIKELEKQCQDSKKKLDYYENINRQLESQLDMFKKANALLGEKIEQLKETVYQFEMEKLSSMNQLEKNSELVNFQTNVNNLKSMLHKSVIRMEGVKEQYEKLKEYNEELVAQRSSLAKRAAVSFQELTPRPKFKQIFSKNQLSFEKLLNPQPSTETIVEFLVKTCKKLYQNKQKQYSSIDEQHQHKIHNNGNINPDQAIKQIKKTQLQINNTLEAAQEVKKAFNNQKKQRQSLQNNRHK